MLLGRVQVCIAADYSTVLRGFAAPVFASALLVRVFAVHCSVPAQSENERGRKRRLFPHSRFPPGCALATVWIELGVTKNAGGLATRGFKDLRYGNRAAKQE